MVPANDAAALLASLGAGAGRLLDAAAARLDAAIAAHAGRLSTLETRVAAAQARALRVGRQPPVRPSKPQGATQIRKGRHGQGRDSVGARPGKRETR